MSSGQVGPGDDGGRTAPGLGATQPGEPLRTELVAVLVAMVGGLPHVLTSAGEARLPSGPLQSQHRSLQGGLRSWVEQQTGHPLGYVEQLYTFADAGRAGRTGRVISVSYLGLTRVAAPSDAWRSWYDLFPWEDQRGDGPTVVDDIIAPMLARWVSSSDPRQQLARRQRRLGAGGAGGGPGSAVQVPDPRRGRRPRQGKRP